ncbi:MAG TPA: isoprenyl transferase [Desulfuromonadales bacterium]|nr:isoprenyl transferase [Desulfuromonadales bacterium]
MQLPQHLAIIMDGNGRWAEQRHLPRIAGHRQGVKTVRKIVNKCRMLGIPYLTLYAFSSENWGRPDDEVGALMGLLSRYLQDELTTMLTEDIRLNVIGETERLPKQVRQTLYDTIAKTADNGQMVLTLALSYGGRDELVRAMRKLGREVESGTLSSVDIDELDVARVLDTKGLPDPDLLVRTSGEMRISNFLLWQLAYAELYFTDVYWPDFGVHELTAALSEYGRRQRRYGLTGAQAHKNEKF